MIRTIRAVATKELRALFQSQIALLFLAVFTLTSNVSFFVFSKFFSRNLADVTPLFEWLPLQLILLVGAVSMRAWAEERKSGTLEILLTLPVRTWSLVLGKFLAGMGLVATALVLTFSIPISVWMLGPLDWGPVIGGYLGAMLLAGAYLAIGLCVSARTDNQVLALLGTLALGGTLYAIGSPQIQTLLGSDAAHLSALLGSGSRFESIGRGVIDLRDLAYYGSIAAFFLALNVYFLDSQRIASISNGGRLWKIRGIVVLALLNAVALNVWLAPVAVARADLTQNGDYSLSPITAGILSDLEEPLLIQGIFSDRSHPKLQPLAPQLKALLREFEVQGDGHVTVEYVDPGKDDDLAQRLEQDYGVNPVPMPIRDRNEQRVVNAWFHVLLKYGDQHQVVAFGDLVELEMSEDGVDVRLRDPEYDITRAVRKVTSDFVSTGALVAKLPPNSKLLLYASPEALDAQGGESLEIMRKVATKTAALGDNLTFEEADPLADPALAQHVLETYGVQPVLSFSTGQRFYLYLVVHIGDTAQRIFPRGEISSQTHQATVDSALARMVPGQRKTVAILTEIPEPAPPRKPNQPPPPPLPPDYSGLQRLLADRFEVTAPLDLSDGSMPDNVDVLIIGKPGAISVNQRLAIDQFLLRGGSVIALAGRARAGFGRTGFRADAENPALTELLAGYGINVGEGQVLDPMNSKMAIPVGREVVQFDYPYFPDIRPETMNTKHLALANLLNVSVPWTSPLSVGALPEGLSSEVLMETSPGSWVRTEPEMMPDFKSFPELGFPVPSERGGQIVGLAVTGRFPSIFTDADRPELPGALTQAVGDGKLVVLGSSEIVGDLILDFANNPTGKYHRNNALLLNNLIDWSLEETDLLQIRNPGAFARTLSTTDPDALFRIEVANYIFGLLPLPFLYLWSRRRRRPAATRGAA